MQLAHSPEQLTELLRRLQALPAEPEPMTVGQVEGYVVGLAVCPEAVPPPEWLPAVWGGDDASVFRIAREAAARAVREHHDRVVRSLLPPAREYMPIYELDGSGEEALWGLWVRGFVRAMGLRGAAWEGIRRGGDEEAAASLAMIEAMHDIVMDRSALDGSAIAEMERIATDLIPSFVETLKPWSAWRRRGARPVMEAAGGRPWASNVLVFPGADSGKR